MHCDGERMWNRSYLYAPDGRVVAFFSTRAGGGLFTANPMGQNAQKISTASGESLRWEGN